MSAKVPKNIRFRQDQIAALTAMQDAETDFSALVRTAVDLLLLNRKAERARRVTEAPGIYGNPPSRKAAARRNAKK